MQTQNWLSQIWSAIWPAQAALHYKVLVVVTAFTFVGATSTVGYKLVVNNSNNTAQQEMAGSAGQNGANGGPQNGNGEENGQDEDGEDEENEDGDKKKPSDDDKKASGGNGGGGGQSGGSGGSSDGSGGSGGGGSSGSGGGSSGGGGSGSCDLPNYPDGSCTGWQHTGVSLSAYTGPSTVTTNGTVIDGKDINSCLNIDADNVTIKRSRIRCDGFWVVRIFGSGTLLEDVEIDAKGFAEANCLTGDDYVARRINCHNTGDGIRLGNNVTIEDSYIHDLVTESGSHNDGMQAVGATNVVIRHNYIENQHSQTSCIILGNEFGPLSNVLIENNLFNGGGYSVYGGGSDSDVDNIRFLNNRFMRSPGGFYANGGFHGPVAHFDSGRPGNQWSGNAWHDNGATISVN